MKLISISRGQWPKEYRDVDNQVHDSTSREEADFIFDNAPVIKDYYIALEVQSDNEGFNISYFLRVYKHY